jgi:hypothetical protein
MVQVEGVPVKLGMVPLHRHLSRIAAYSLLFEPFKVLMGRMVQISHSLHEADLMMVLDYHTNGRAEAETAKLEFTGPALQFEMDPNFDPVEATKKGGAEIDRVRALPAPVGTSPGLAGKPVPGQRRPPTLPSNGKRALMVQSGVAGARKPPVPASRQLSAPLPSKPETLPSAPMEVARIPLVVERAPAQIPTSDASRRAAARRVVERAVERVRSRGEEEYPDKAVCGLGPGRKDLDRAMSKEGSRRLRDFEQDYREALWGWRGKKADLPELATPWSIIRRYVVDAPVVAPHGVAIYAACFQEACTLCGSLYTRDEIRVAIFLFNAVVRLWRGSVSVDQLTKLIEKAEVECARRYGRPTAATISREGRKIIAARAGASAAWGKRSVTERLQALEHAREGGPAASDLFIIEQ